MCPSPDWQFQKTITGKMLTTIASSAAGKNADLALVKRICTHPDVLSFAPMASIDGKPAAKPKKGLGFYDCALCQKQNMTIGEAFKGLLMHCCSPTHLALWIPLTPEETRSAAEVSEACGDTWGKGRRGKEARTEMTHQAAKKKKEAKDMMARVHQAMQGPPQPAPAADATPGGAVEAGRAAAREIAEL